MDLAELVAPVSEVTFLAHVTFAVDLMVTAHRGLEFGVENHGWGVGLFFFGGYLYRNLPGKWI